MSLSDLNKKLASIQVVGGMDLNAAAPPAEQRSEEEDWAINRNAVEQHGKRRDWRKVLEALVYLSNKDEHPDNYKAMAQAAWLALKTDAPAVELTVLLYNILVSVGPKHAAAGPLASLAHLMAQHRTPDHPDRELALAHSNQMLKFASDGQGVEDEAGFHQWVADNRLNEPDHFIPIVMELLEGLVRGDWWIDTQLIQQEMLQANQQKAAADKS